MSWERDVRYKRPESTIRYLTRRYESKNKVLEEKEADLRLKLSVLKMSLPTVVMMSLMEKTNEVSAQISDPRLTNVNRPMFMSTRDVGGRIMKKTSAFKEVRKPDSMTSVTVTRQNSSEESLPPDKKPTDRQLDLESRLAASQRHRSSSWQPEMAMSACCFLAVSPYTKFGRQEDTAKLLGLGTPSCKSSNKDARGLSDYITRAPPNRQPSKDAYDSLFDESPTLFGKQLDQIILGGRHKDREDREKRASSRKSSIQVAVLESSEVSEKKKRLAERIRELTDMEKTLRMRVNRLEKETAKEEAKSSKPEEQEKKLEKSWEPDGKLLGVRHQAGSSSRHKSQKAGKDDRTLGKAMGYGVKPDGKSSQKQGTLSELEMEVKAVTAAAETLRKDFLEIQGVKPSKPKVPVNSVVDVVPPESIERKPAATNVKIGKAEAKDIFLQRIQELEDRNSVLRKQIKRLENDRESTKCSESRFCQDLHSALLELQRLQSRLIGEEEVEAVGPKPTTTELTKPTQAQPWEAGEVEVEYDKTGNINLRVLY